MNNSICYVQVRKLGQAALARLTPISSENLIWKTDEDDPRKHNSSHLGFLYQLPQDEKQILKIYGANSPFDPKKTRYYKVMGIERFPIMIRQPALDAMSYIEKIESNESPLPNVRILFYGDEGTGKTNTLKHLLHYLHLKEHYCILDLNHVQRFTVSPWGYEDSQTRPGRIDTPLNAAILLQSFKLQNADYFEKHPITCSKEYKWSKREVTSEGESLMKVVEHGINRINHASDCFAVLCKELMLAADEGKIKLASLIDNVRFLYTFEACNLKHKDMRQMYVDEVTVARAYKKIVKNSYKNGITLATCDHKLMKKHNQTPREVMGDEGWEHFNPCLPIKMPVFNREEFENYMNFLQDMGWLCRPETRTVEARDEIRFVSGMNPLQIIKLCRSE